MRKQKREAGWSEKVGEWVLVTDLLELTPEELSLYKP